MPGHGIHENSIIVSSAEVSPVVYAVTSVIGAGLRSKEITIAFAKKINHTLQKLSFILKKSHDGAQ